MNRSIRALVRLGKKTNSYLAYAGKLSILFAQTVAWVFMPPFTKRRHIFDQMKKIGVDSLPIVFMTALFTGIVLALQSAYQLAKMEADMYVASLVAMSMCRELGPVLTALVVAGRVGAAITAELGTMRVTEQIDALDVMATNPINYLIVPRFLAIVVMLPLLTIYSDIIGMAGGYLVGVFKLNIGSSMYINLTFDQLITKDFVTGLLKAFFFSIIIAIVSCYHGFTAEGGAEGVGKATTLSVVISFILIIAADCLFTALFYFVF